MYNFFLLLFTCKKEIKLNLWKKHASHKQKLTKIRKDHSKSSTFTAISCNFSIFNNFLVLNSIFERRILFGGNFIDSSCRVSLCKNFAKFRHETRGSYSYSSSLGRKRAGRTSRRIDEEVFWTECNFLNIQVTLCCGTTFCKGLYLSSDPRQNLLSFQRSRFPNFFTILCSSIETGSL